MRKTISVLCVFIILAGHSLFAVGDTFIDYQNYNHGYCPECNYYPCQCDTGYCPNAEPCPTCPNGAPPPYPLNPGSCPPQPSPCDKEENDVCGISICWIAVILVVVATAAAIIVGANNGRVPS